MAQRWAVARMLDDGLHYADISRRTGASTATITRIASWLNHGEGGYRGALDRLKAKGAKGGRARPRRPPRRRRASVMRERLRLAVPNKGRLVEPTLGLLHDAGLVFEEHDRSLVARVQNLPIDILFVRTNDVIEFVGDGVADVGITGQDLLAETGAELPVLRPLGYGRCRLAAAVPADAPNPGHRRPRRSPRRHGPPGGDPPVLRRAARPGRRHHVVRGRGGRAPARPRRGHRGPRVDGLDAGHERPAARSAMCCRRRRSTSAARRRSKERPDEIAAIDTMLASVIAARDRKYLMMNAPSDRLPELEAICPASTARRSSRWPMPG